MGYYKIKNITNTLAKRHPRKDSVIKIDHKDGIKTKPYDLKSGEQITISCGNLPANLHLHRMKGLISVTEISENEFNKGKSGSIKLSGSPQKGIVVKQESSSVKKNEEKVVDEDDTTKKTSTKPKTSTKKKSTKDSTSTSSTTTTSSPEEKI